MFLLLLACVPPKTDAPVADDSAPVADSPVDTGPPPPFTFSTPSWADGGDIPSEFTCDGEGGWGNQRNPELVWADPPEGTVGFAVVYVDVTINDWRHWAFFTHDAALRGIPQETSNTGALPGGVIELRSGDGRVGYVPNCPSGQRHAYTFTIWALGAELGLDADASFGQLRAAAEANGLGSLSFTGFSDAG